MSATNSPDPQSPDCWRVVFGPSSAVLISKRMAPTPETASIEARLAIWLATGRWLSVQRVEEST